VTARIRARGRARRVVAGLVVALVLASGVPSVAGAAPASATFPDGDPAGVRAGRTEAPSRLRSAGLGGDTVGGGGPALAAPLVPAAVTVGPGLDALTGNPNLRPGDPTGAAGDAHLVAAVRASYAVYDLTPAAVLGPAPLRRLVPLPSEAKVRDPRVVYDHFNDTFVLAFLALRRTPRLSRIVVVSIPDATADDRDTWCARSLAGDRTPGDGSQFADDLDVGFDGTRVVLTTNQHAWDGTFAYAQVLSVKAAHLSDCDRSSVSVTKFAAAKTRNPDGTQAFAIRPARTDHTAGTEPGHLYLVSFTFRSISGRTLTLWRLRPSGGKLRLTRVSRSVGLAIIAPFGTQRGGSVGRPNTWWDTGDLRFVDAFYDAERNRLYAAHAVEADTGSGDYLEAAIRWYEIRPETPLTGSVVTRKGIVGVADRDLAYPSVATDGAGTLLIAHARAGVRGAGQYLSFHVAQVDPGQSGRTFAGTTQLRAGEARFEASPGPERWGTTSAIARDRGDPERLWAFGQYVVDDGDGPSATWGLRLQRVSAGP
jgi:hypothetical protein